MNDDLNLEISDKLLYKMFNRSISAILNTTIKLSITEFSSAKDIIGVFLEKIRKDNELNPYIDEKLYTPQFIIAAINKDCSFKGTDYPNKDDFKAELTSNQWGDIFRQAYELGISFIIISGSEPLLKKSVLKECSNQPKIIFPTFTDINLISEEWLEFFSENRNVIPIIKLNRNKSLGNFLIKKSDIVENLFNIKKILFGISMTVTKENFEIILSEEYIMKYKNKGCIAIVFSRYNDAFNNELTLTKEQQLELDERINKLRVKFKCIFTMMTKSNNYNNEEIEFSKGIIHISSCGVIKECEYSVYADMNLQYTSLKTAINALVPHEEERLFELIESEGDISKLLEEEDNEFLIDKDKSGLTIIKSIKNDKS